MKLALDLNSSSSTFFLKLVKKNFNWIYLYSAKLQHTLSQVTLQSKVKTLHYFRKKPNSFHHEQALDKRERDTSPLVFSAIFPFFYTQSGGGVGWLKWFYGKGKNEAHLPDDKNKSVSYSYYMCMSHFSIPLYSVSHFSHFLCSSISICHQYW